MGNLQQFITIMAQAALRVLRPAYAAARLPMIAQTAGIDPQRLEALYQSVNPDPLSLTGSEWERLMSAAGIPLEAWVAEARRIDPHLVDDAVTTSEPTTFVVYASGSLAEPPFKQQQSIRDTLNVTTLFFSEVSRLRNASHSK